MFLGAFAILIYFISLMIIIQTYPNADVLGLYA